MPQTLASLIGLIVILLICGGTALVGGSRERKAAAATAGGVVASILVQRVANAWDPVWPLTLVDGAVLIAFMALAWKPRSRWPIWAVGFQGVTVAVDLLRIADPRMAPYTYLTAVALSTYGLAAVIAYAGWSSRGGRHA